MASCSRTNGGPISYQGVQGRHRTVRPTLLLHVYHACFNGFGIEAMLDTLIQAQQRLGRTRALTRLECAYPYSWRSLGGLTLYMTARGSSYSDHRTTYTWMDAHYPDARSMRHPSAIFRLIWRVSRRHSSQTSSDRLAKLSASWGIQGNSSIWISMMTKRNTVLRCTSPTFARFSKGEINFHCRYRY